MAGIFTKVKRVIGSKGDDTIIGHNDELIIEGGDGDDVIYVGTGKTDLIGGAGNDKFIITDYDSEVIIKDYDTDNVEEQIILQIPRYSGLAMITQNDKGAELDLGELSITLEGKNASKIKFEETFKYSEEIKSYYDFLLPLKIGAVALAGIVSCCCLGYHLYNKRNSDKIGIDHSFISTQQAPPDTVNPNMVTVAFSGEGAMDGDGDNV